MRRDPASCGSGTLLLSGWLFADLLLGAMIIFLVSMPGMDPQPPITPTPAPISTPRPPVADHLVFWQQPPAAAIAGQPLTREPIVAVISDQGRILVTDNTTTIDLVALSLDPSLFVCNGGTTRQVVDGLARFTGCVLNAAGTAQLRADGGGLRPVASEQIVIAPAPTSTPKGPCNIDPNPFQVDIASGPGGAIPTDAQLRQALDDFQGRRAGIVITTTQAATIGDGLALAGQVNARLDALYATVFRDAVKRPIRSDIVRGRGFTNLEIFFFTGGC